MADINSRQDNQLYSLMQFIPWVHLYRVAQKRLCGVLIFFQQKLSLFLFLEINIFIYTQDTQGVNGCLLSHIWNLQEKGFLKGFFRCSRTFKRFHIIDLTSACINQKGTLNAIVLFLIFCLYIKRRLHTSVSVIAIRGQSAQYTFRKKKKGCELELFCPVFGTLKKKGFLKVLFRCSRTLKRFLKIMLP